MSFNEPSNFTKVDSNQYEIYDFSSNKIFGFWIYLMSDCILFVVLFIMYITSTLNSMINEINYNKIFNLPILLSETLLLLSSSLTCSVGIFKIYSNNHKKVAIWLEITLLLGLSFILIEINEFYHLITHGYSISYNAFLSSFFTLVGTHGIHVIIGLIWILVMIIQITYFGLNKINIIRLQCLSLFWHFLDIIWICVFNVVYLVHMI